MANIREDKNLSRFMMYFKPETLGELRVLSRMLGVAMVDYVCAAMTAYVFSRQLKTGLEIPERTRKRFVGPRKELATATRIRYVMRLDKNVVDRVRDIAFLDNRRFSQVCDDALSNFIKFTKEARDFKNVWLDRSDIEAIRGRKSSKSNDVIEALLNEYKATPHKSGKNKE